MLSCFNYNLLHYSNRYVISLFEFNDVNLLLYIVFIDFIKKRYVNHNNILLKLRHQSRSTQIFDKFKKVKHCSLNS